jgi:hypothetical protein
MANIQFAFHPETGQVIGATVSTNRDSRIEKMSFNIQTGTFELKGYSGNGSSLGAIQAEAQAKLFETTAASTQAALGVVEKVLPLLKTVVPVP